MTATQTQPPIKPLREVEREHIEATLAAHPEVPQYRIAMELGISPTTLIRKRKRWRGR